MEVKEFEKKEELFQAALKEFTEKSYNQASLNTIIKNAGMSKGSFYYYFKNKMHLYKFVINEVGKIEESFNERWIKENNVNLENLGLFDILEIHGRAGIDMLTEYPEYYEFWKRIIKEDHPEIKTIINERSIEHLDSLLNPFIQNSIDKGEIRTDFSIEFINSIISNILLIFFFSIIGDSIELGGEKILRDYNKYLDFIRNGLGKK